MAKEIERKFLVSLAKWNALEKPEGKYLKQSYLSTDPSKTIRLRIIESEAWIGIKGKMKGITRSEYEYQIPIQDAIDMMDEFSGKSIEKTRFVIPFAGNNWEVDVFLGENAGLIVAEIELESENEVFSKPEWITNEVTTDSKYLNVMLQEQPYKSWL